MQVSPDTKREVALAMAAARPGKGKSRLADSYATLYGATRQTIYRWAAEAGYGSGKKQRSDKGESIISDEEAKLVSACLLTTRRKSNHITATTPVIKRLLDDSGKLPGASTSTINRRLRELAAEKKALTAPTPHVDLISEHPTESQLKQGCSQQETEVADGIRDGLGTESESLLDKVLDSSKGIIEQLPGLGVTVRAYVSEIDGLVSSLEGTLGDIANPANSLIGSISFATNLPGRIVGAIAHTAERYATLYESIEDSPNLFIQGFEDGMAELKNSLGLNDAPSSKATPKTAAAQTNAKNLISKQIDIAVALVVSQKVGEIYAADETDRNTVRRAEEVSAFDVLGNYGGANPLPEILSITELERSLATVRTHIQSAVDQARGMQALHDMAKSLLKHVNEIKLERERIIEVELTEETPLHLVCLQYGLPYNYAERILTLNPQLENPNFATGTIKIYSLGRS